MMDNVVIYGRKYGFLGHSSPSRIQFNNSFFKRLKILPRDTEFSRLQKSFPHIKGYIILTDDGNSDDMAVYQLHSKTRIAMGYLDASDGRIFDNQIKDIKNR